MPTQDIPEEKKELISTFNAAKLQVWRLHTSWEICDKLRRTGQLDKLKYELHQQWDKLYAKVKKRGDDSTIKDYEQLENDLEKIDTVRHRTKFYNKLRQIARFLEFVQEDVGLGGVMKSSDEDEIEE